MQCVRYSYSKVSPPFRNSASGPTTQPSTTLSPKRKGENSMKRSGMGLKLPSLKFFVSLSFIPPYLAENFQ
jgi:hypothetical protein